MVWGRFLFYSIQGHGPTIQLLNSEYGPAIQIIHLFMNGRVKANGEKFLPALFMVRMSISMNTLHDPTISMSTPCLLLLLV